MASRLSVETSDSRLTITSGRTGVLLSKRKKRWCFDSVLGWDGRRWQKSSCSSPFEFDGFSVESWPEASNRSVTLWGPAGNVTIARGGAGLRVQFGMHQTAGSNRARILSIGALDQGAILGSLRFVTRSYRNNYVSGFPGAVAVMRGKLACALLLDPEYDDQWAVSKTHGNLERGNFVTFPFFYDRRSMGIAAPKGDSSFVPLYLLTEKMTQPGWRGLVYAAAEMANRNLPNRGPSPPTPEYLLEVIRQHRDDAYAQWIEPYGYPAYVRPDGTRDKKWPEMKENWPLLSAYNLFVASALAEVRSLGLMPVSKEFLLKAARSAGHYQRPCGDTGGIVLALYDDGRVGDYIGDRFYEGINCINIYTHAMDLYCLFRFLKHIRDRKVEKIVGKGLEFLKSVQYPDGSFPAAYNFIESKVPKEKKKSVGITGIAALVFLEAYEYFGDKELLRMAAEALRFTRREWHSWGTEVDINWNWLDYDGGIWIAWANLKAYEVFKERKYLEEADYWLHYVLLALIRYENDARLPSANALHEVAMEWEQPFKQHSMLFMPDIRGRIASYPDIFFLLSPIAMYYKHTKDKMYGELFDRILATAVCGFRMTRTNYVPKGTTTEQWNTVEDSELVGGAFTGGLFIWGLLTHRRAVKELLAAARRTSTAAAGAA